jgi:Leucine-rich repeat (LRR) protein
MKEDSLAYRFAASNKDNNDTLDLSYLDLSTFPEIPDYIKHKIRHLFASENCFTELPDLTDYKNLIALDVSCNKLKKINNLPKSLEELHCRDNKIESLPSGDNLPKLKRLDCSLNRLPILMPYMSLENLVCDNNELETLHCPNKVKRLLCCNNKIISISGCKNVKYLECSNNQLKTLPKLPKIIDLIMNNNPVGQMNVYDSIKYLELFGTKINVMPYMPTLEEIYCYKDSIQEISKSYREFKNIDIKIHKDQLLHLTFANKNNLNI